MCVCVCVISAAHNRVHQEWRVREGRGDPEETLQRSRRFVWEGEERSWRYGTLVSRVSRVTPVCVCVAEEAAGEPDPEETLVSLGAAAQLVQRLQAGHAGVHRAALLRPRALPHAGPSPHPH